jgi:hypothetical protein
MRRGNLAAPLFGRLAVVVAMALGGAAGAIGCLSSSNSSPGPGTTPELDAGKSPTPVLDASGSVTPPTPDAAPPVNDDAGVPSDDAGPPPFDAGPPDAAPATASQVGLVGGGTLSRSAHYVLVGSTGPATAPVLNSSSYQLTGGMAASTQK